MDNDGILGHLQTASHVLNEVLRISRSSLISLPFFSIYGQLLSYTPSSSSLILLVFLFALNLMISKKKKQHIAIYFSTLIFVHWFWFNWGKPRETGVDQIQFFSSVKKRNLSTKFYRSRYLVSVKAMLPSSICCMVSWDLPLILPVTVDDGFNPVFLWWYIFLFEGATGAFSVRLRWY